jgi:hypothetical protein
VNGIVQAKLIGGFGNQLHQYVSARKYAELMGAKLEVLDWVGRDIFGLTEPEWSCELPDVNDGASGAPPAVKWGEVNIRLSGYFQVQRWVAILTRSELQAWLVPRPELVKMCRGALPATGYTAAHLRQGDYMGHPCFANVPRASYERACREHGLRVDEWVEQDRPRRVQGIPDRLHFLPDWLVLLRATTLIRANSTFSWWAAALGNAVVYAPIVDDHTGDYDATFARGNWPRCAHTDRTGVQIENLQLPGMED